MMTNQKSAIGSPRIYSREDVTKLYIIFIMRYMLNSEKILELLGKNEKETNAFGAKRLGIFGSYARGEQRKGSDVDILVEFEKGKKTFHNYMQLKFFLEKLLGRKVDLVIKEAIKPMLKSSILRSVKYAT